MIHRDANSKASLGRPSDDVTGGTQPHDAAEHCNGLSNVHGHSDWYLPAQDELNLFWNGGAPVAGVLIDGTWYWSSTESSQAIALVQRFSDSLVGGAGKNLSKAVRCVRK